MISLRIILQACFVFLLGFPLPTAKIAVFQQGAGSQAEDPSGTYPVANHPCSGSIVPAANPAFEQAVIEKANQVRAEYQLPPLKHVETLDQAARAHAADMNASNYVNHNSFHRENGTLVQDCDTFTRIQTYYGSWIYIGENIGAGHTTPDQVIEGWLNSPAHRDNLLNPNYREVGVGFFQGSGDFHYYWAINFGARDQVYPLILAADQAQTTTRNIPTYVYGSFDQMRLKNDQDAWGAWQPFTSAFSWTLPEDQGTHTVTIEMKGPEGKVYTSTDTIQLAP